MHTVFQIWQSTDSTAQRVGSWSPAYCKPTSEFKATTVRNLFPYANICRLPAARDPHPTASIKITRCEEYDDRVQRHLCSVPPMNCNSSNPPPSYTLLDVAPPAPASRKRIGTLDGHNRIISENRIHPCVQMQGIVHISFRNTHSDPTTEPSWARRQPSVACRRSDTNGCCSVNPPESHLQSR